MTAPAILGLTFDGTDVQDTDGLFLQIISGLFDGLDVRGKDVVVPYLAGQVPRARRADTRRILLVGWCRGSGSTQDDRVLSYRAERANMMNLFDVTAMPATLEVTYPDASTKSISARTLNLVATEDVLAEFATVSIELLSTDPDWTSPGS